MLTRQLARGVKWMLAGTVAVLVTTTSLAQESALLAAPASGMSADISLTMTDSPDPVTLGGAITYSIIVTNSGPDSATQAELIFLQPQGVRFHDVEAPPGWECSIVQAPPLDPIFGLYCDTTSFATGAVTFVLTATISQTSPSVIINHPFARSTTPDPNPANNSIFTTTAVVPGADLSIEKMGGGGQVRPGDDISYRLFFFKSGSGSSPANSVIIEDALPLGTTFVSLAVSPVPPGWICTTPAVGSNGTVRCTIPTLAQTFGAYVTLVARVASGTAGTTLRNTATINSTTFDPNIENNSSSVVSLVQSGSEVADIALSITDSPDPVLPGGDITYTMTLANNGPDTAVSAHLGIQFPDGDDVSIAAPASWTCEFLVPPPVIPPPPAYVNCRTPIFPFGSATFTFVLRPKPSATGPLVLTAQAASATGDPNAANNSATATTNTIFGVGVAVPSLSPALLAMLALLLAFVGVRAVGRRA